MSRPGLPPVARPVAAAARRSFAFPVEPDPLEAAFAGATRARGTGIYTPGPAPGPNGGLAAARLCRIATVSAAARAASLAAQRTTTGAVVRKRIETLPLKRPSSAIPPMAKRRAPLAVMPGVAVGDGQAVVGVRVSPAGDPRPPGAGAVIDSLAARLRLRYLEEAAKREQHQTVLLDEAATRRRGTSKFSATVPTARDRLSRKLGM